MSPLLFISVLKIEYQVVLVSLISNFFTNKTSLANKWMSFSSSNSALDKLCLLSKLCPANSKILYKNSFPGPCGRYLLTERTPYPFFRCPAMIVSSLFDIELGGIFILPFRNLQLESLKVNQVSTKSFNKVLWWVIFLEHNQIVWLVWAVLI